MNILEKCSRIGNRQHHVFSQAIINHVQVRRAEQSQQCIQLGLRVLQTNKLRGGGRCMQGSDSW